MRKKLLNKALSGRSLDFSEAEEAGRALASGQVGPLVTAAFLGALSARGEVPGELAGLASAFLEAVSPFPPAPDAVDTCGTGGDGKNTFNLSTASAVVAASLGQPVAKHGNRSVSGSCGSADLLEGAGFPVLEPAEEAARRLEAKGFAFLFAPLYHPAMAHVAPVRKSLGVRTLFNLLGPLLNPASVGRQVVGVYDRNRMSLMAESLSLLGLRRAFVIHGEGGYDEVVLHGRVFVSEVTDGRTENYVLTHRDFGLPPGDASDLKGGGVERNLFLFASLLMGRAPEGLANAVAAGTALALKASGLFESLAEGAAAAREALASGRTEAYFNDLLDQKGEVNNERVS